MGITLAVVIVALIIYDKWIKSAVVSSFESDFEDEE